MTALSADRNTPSRAGDLFEPPMAAALIYAGAIVCLNSSGYATKGATATGLIAIGRAEEQVDNSGGSPGDLRIKVRRGVFRFANSTSTDEIGLTEVGKACYIVDDQTVAKTSATGTRSRAGFVIDVDDQGVWVLVGYGLLNDPTGALLAANNLSDVGSAATARANIGANKIWLPVEAPDLVGANAAVYRVLAPVGGAITQFSSVLNDALETGNATLTLAIAGTPVTNGAITITQSGSAAGDVDSATPSGANTVTAGQVITITVGGTNDAAVGASALVEITY